MVTLNRSGLTWVLLFVLVATVHMLSSAKQNWDSKWVLQTAYSICTSGNTDLVEWRDTIPEDDYRIMEIDGRPYSYFPDGVAILVAPIVGIWAWLDGAGGENPSLSSWNISDVQEILASLIVALTAVLLGWSGMQLGLSRWRAVVLALIFAFGTSAWSSASRALWSHAPTMLSLTAGVYFLLRAHSARSGYATFGLCAGLALGFGFVCRPTAAIPAVVLTLLAFRWQPRLGLFVLVGGATIAVAFALHSLHNYGSALPPYYKPSRLAGSHTLWEALAGHLVSPSRGLFIYSPVCAVAILGLIRWQGERRDLAWAALAVFVSQWFAIASFPHWWGGHCYGPRLFSDVVPVVLLGLVPFLLVGKDRATQYGRFARICLVAAIGVSVAMNAIGANVKAAGYWNPYPVNVDREPQRIWDWSDPQFLRWEKPLE